MKWVQPIAESLLQLLRPLLPFEEDHGKIPTFVQLKAISNVGLTYGHLRAYMKTQTKYLAMKLDFLRR